VKAISSPHPPPPPLGEYVNVAVTYDNGVMLYVNGEAAGST